MVKHKGSMHPIDVPADVLEANVVADGKTKRAGKATETSGARTTLTPQELLGRGRQILSEVEEGSPFFRSHEPRNFPDFDAVELKLGPRLGEGAFCSVYEVVDIQLLEDRATSPKNMGGEQEGEEDNKESSNDTLEDPVVGEKLRNSSRTPRKSILVMNGTFENAVSETTMDTETCGGADDDEPFSRCPDLECERHVMSERCLRKDMQTGQSHSRYAIKRLKRRGIEEDDRIKGVIDLAIEAKFLSSLVHPNVIKMRGLATGDPLGDRFFVVLDRLFGTLDDRLLEWKQERIEFAGHCCGMLGANKEGTSDLWVDILLVGYDIASAVRYLHKNKIVYRDLKPENIGFDVRGDVKIFDFGLAKELRSEDRVEKDAYKITGRTGSLLYMAPEVACCKPYGLPADSYSFGMLLWEMCAQDQPFQSFTAREVYHRVSIGGFRPLVEHSWPRSAKVLIKKCWDVYATKRPIFEDICTTLRSGFVKAAEKRGDDAINRTEHFLNVSERSLRGIPDFPSS